MPAECPLLTPGGAVLSIALARVSTPNVLDLHNRGAVSVEALERLSTSRSSQDASAFITVIGRTLTSYGGEDLLRDTINSLETPDLLVDAMDCVAGSIEPEDDTVSVGDERDAGLYKPMSSAGWFLRKTVVEFKAMQFDQVCALHRCILEMPKMAESRSVTVESRIRVEQMAESIASSLSRGEEPSQELLSAKYEIPQVYQIDLMNHYDAIRRKDYSSAVHTLHRYYDRSISEQGGQSPQDAVLSLASMGFSFGYSEAPIALAESIRIAQKVGDQACQSQVTEWIARTGSSTKQYELLQFLTGQTNEPASNNEHTAAVHQRRANALIALAKAHTEGLILSPPHIEKIEVVIEKTAEAAAICPSLAADALLVEATAWTFNGCLLLSHIRSKFALQRAPPKSDQWSRVVAALGTVEFSMGEEKEAIYRLQTALQAVSVNSSVEPGFRRPQNELLSQCLTKFQFEKALRKGHYRQAAHFCDILNEAADAGREGTMFVDSSELSCDAREAKARFCIAQEDVSQAIEIGEQLVERAMSLHKPVRALGGLLLCAEARLLVHDAALSLKLTLAVLTIAKSMHLHAICWRACIKMSQALESLGEATAAVECLQGVLPSILEGLPLQDKAHAHLALAFPLMSMGNYLECVSHLRLADSILVQTESWVDRQRGLQLLMKALHVLGDHKGRNRVAKEFLLNVALIRSGIDSAA